MLSRDLFPENGICLQKYIYDLILGRSSLSSALSSLAVFAILAVVLLTVVIMISHSVYEYYQVGWDKRRMAAKSDQSG
jgi:hypothetical protein